MRFSFSIDQLRQFFTLLDDLPPHAKINFIKEEDYSVKKYLLSDKKVKALPSDDQKKKYDDLQQEMREERKQAHPARGSD